MMEDGAVKGLPALDDIPFVVLAGGLGTRLRPAVSDRPKALAPVGGRPFLELLLQLLKQQGARRFILCVGYMAEDIRQFLGRGEKLGVVVDYSVEQEDSLLGTGGALRAASALFDGQAVVLNGDTYLPVDYRALLAAHRRCSYPQAALATLALSRVEQAGRYGQVELDERQRFVAAFKEKPPSGASPAACGPVWVNAGAYVLEHRLLDLIPPRQRCSLERDVFPDILKQGGRLAAFCTDEMFFDIGTPESLDAFQRFYLTGETTRS